MHTCGRTCAAGVHFCQGCFVLVLINHMLSIAPLFTYGFLHLFRIFSILLVLHFPIEACYCNTYMYILLILLRYNVSISTHHWLVIYTRASIEFLVPQTHSVFLATKKHVISISGSTVLPSQLAPENLAWRKVVSRCPAHFVEWSMSILVGNMLWTTRHGLQMNGLG